MEGGTAIMSKIAAAWPQLKAVIPAPTLSL